MVTKRYLSLPLMLDELLDGINNTRTKIGDFLNIYIQVQSRSIRATVNMCTNLSQKATVARMGLCLGN